jgi:HAD superfamily hydrolase (TIGR01549 family)
MIKNIFLDAGEVILDEKDFEDNSSRIITDIIYNFNGNYSIINYWQDIEESSYRFVPKTYDYVLYKNIHNINEFKKAKESYKKRLKQIGPKFELLGGIRDFLMNFSKNYKIGILGQYGNDFKKYLEEQELLSYFTFTEIQDNYNITKPDPRYFLEILKKCDCKPEESIMVGDRIDKDIIPARMVGMKTIRIIVGIHKNQEPRVPEEIPDLTVEKIEDIKLEIIKAMDYCA